MKSVITNKCTCGICKFCQIFARNERDLALRRSKIKANRIWKKEIPKTFLTRFEFLTLKQATPSARGKAIKKLALKRGVLGTSIYNWMSRNYPTWRTGLRQDSGHANC